MDIQVTMTEHEIQKIAKSIGKPVSTQEATKVLQWAAKTLEALRAAGRPRIFETVVLSILRGKPDYDEEGKLYPHPTMPDSGNLCENCEDFNKCGVNNRPCETPGHAQYCPPSMYEP